MSWQLEQHVFRAGNLLALEWLDHGFGTASSTDWNGQDDLTSLSQVHSDVCVYAAHGPGRVGRGDALVTDVAGLRIGVRTADCVPILLADPRHHAVAAIHAGWRGTVQAICLKTVHAMVERFGSSPDELIVAIGPSIGGCCYRVGGEVAREFMPWFPERGDLDGAALVDLRETNRRQLMLAGVPAPNIEISRSCTLCGGEQFYSWRKNRLEKRRMVNSIRIK